MKVLEQVEQGDSIVVVQRRDHANVAMIAANELSSLLEWSQQQLSEPSPQVTAEPLRSELEAELVQEKASKI